MRRLEVSREADLEAEDILRHSEAEFGPAAADRYRLLIQGAYRDLAENPARPGVRTLGGIPADIRLYPIRHSRQRIPPADRVGQPRHVVAFRFDDARVQIVHILHESMDLPRRLGEDPDPEGGA